MNAQSNQKIAVLGIDLGKQTFHVHGVDAQGESILRKKMTRTQLVEFLARLEPCLIGMEACGSAHHWARLGQRCGHEVRLMSPQFVKPYLKSNKNDYLDAEAICEAVQRPNMRFVAVKSVDQQVLQELHRARSLAVGQRTALINQIRGVLFEHGITLPQGVHVIRKALPEILEDADNALGFALRELLAELLEAMIHADDRVDAYDRKIAVLSQQNASCQRLMSIPGIGPLIATALIAAVGNGHVFKNGREMAAWLGLVPRQHSTGGRSVLLGISKRGDTYLRALLIHGARAVVRCAAKKSDRRSRWIIDVAQRRGTAAWCQYRRRGTSQQKHTHSLGTAYPGRDLSH